MIELTEKDIEIKGIKNFSHEVTGSLTISIRDNQKLTEIKALKQQILKWQRESSYYDTQKEKIAHLENEIEYLKTNSTNVSKKLEKTKDEISFFENNCGYSYVEFIRALKKILYKESEDKK